MTPSGIPQNHQGRHGITLLVSEHSCFNANGQLAYFSSYQARTYSMNRNERKENRHGKLATKGFVKVPMYQGPRKSEANEEEVSQVG